MSAPRSARSRGQILQPGYRLDPPPTPSPWLVLAGAVCAIVLAVITALIAPTPETAEPVVQVTSSTQAGTIQLYTHDR